MNSNQAKSTSGRHCMVVHAHYPLAETRVEREAMALLDDDIEVDVICLRDPGESASGIVDGVQVYRLPLHRHKGSAFVVQLLEYLIFFALAFVRVATLHLRKRYEVVQVHNLPDFLVFAALVPKLTGARVILDLHDLMPEFYAERFGQSLDSVPVRLVRWQERLACRFADHVITVTELWRQTLIGRGQPPDKVTVVMNAPDDRIFDRNAAADLPGGSEIAKGKAGDDGRFTLLYHGAMSRRHGLDLALRAMDLVRKEVPDVQLILHGSGDYWRALVNLAEELDLREHVQFSTQVIPSAHLPALLKRADLAVVPYRNGVFTGDILPTKLMEYAALGIPAVAARTPAIAAHFDETAVQFFTPGDVGELADCILALYRDRSRLARLVRGITELGERYKWSNQQVDYLRLVERLAGRED